MEDGSDAARGRMSGLMAGCPGRAGCPGWSGRMFGLGIRRTPRGEDKSGAKFGRFVDGNWGKDGEKLDLPATHEIRGSNPTKLHHTNKSQKKMGQSSG